MSAGGNASPYFQLLLTSNAYVILCAPPPLKLLQCFSLITNLSCSTHGLSLSDFSESIFTPLSILILIIQSQPTCYLLSLENSLLLSVAFNSQFKCHFFPRIFSDSPDLSVLPFLAGCTFPWGHSPLCQVCFCQADCLIRCCPGRC